MPAIMSGKHETAATFPVVPPHGTPGATAHGGHGAHGGKKAIVAALIANLGIAIAKFVGFLLTRSSSLLAESGHSFADSANQGLLLLGGAQAKREEDDQHQFGYGMVRYFWSFVVALILFSLGSLFALYEGISKLRNPHELESPAIAIGILSVAIVLEAFSFRTAVVEARPFKSNQSWWSFIRNAKAPELPVVLLEDSGALLGLMLALSGVGMALLTDDSNWDAYSTISIGLLLGVIAAILVVEMRSLLLGESASAPDAEALRSAIRARA